MKVLNLRCDGEHRFEGWFASEADFQSQQARALLTCPVCDSHEVVRLPSAPRLNVSKAPVPSADRRAAEPPAADSQTAMPTGTEPGASTDSSAARQLRAQAVWWQAVHRVLRNTEDVGDRFPEEARRIHYGEAKERGIRGQASADEAQALKDEGIEVAALPLPDGLKKPVH